MSDFFESTDIKGTKEVSRGVKLTLLIFTLASTLLIIFQKYIYDWLINLTPSPIYKIFVGLIIAFHIFGILILIIGSFLAITGKLAKKPLLLLVYFSAMFLVLFGTVISFISGVDCFLTAIEKIFRLLAEMPGYRGGFIAYYINGLGIGIAGISISVGFAILFVLALLRLITDKGGGSSLKLSILVLMFFLLISIGLGIYRLQTFGPISYIRDEESVTLIEGEILELTSDKIQVKDNSGKELEFKINEATYFQKQQNNAYSSIDSDDVKSGDRTLIRIKSDTVISVLILGAQE